MGEHLELIEPEASWRDAYLTLVEDYLAAGEERYRRRRDLATERLRAAGVTSVMVVCGKDNAASRRVVEKNGGVIAFERYSPTLQTWLYGYRMELGTGRQGREE